MSLRAKLVLWYTAVFGLSGCVLVTALYWLIAHKLQSEADSFLQDEYRECARLTLDALPDLARLADAVEREVGGNRDFPLTYRLVDTRAGREVVFRANPRCHNLPEERPPIDGPVEAKVYSRVLLGGKATRPWRLLTGPLHPEGHPGLVLEVGMYARRLHKRIVALRRYLFLILVAVLAAATAGGWFLASRSLKPIKEMAAELGRIESSTLGERLAVGASGEEVDRLREAVNRMLARLQEAFDKLQHFTAAAAHELRTPLAALQCRLEVEINDPGTAPATREALSGIFARVAELSRLVEDLLLLARLDAAAALPEAEVVVLGALLRDVAEPFALLAEEKAVQLSVACEDDLATEGDPVLLRSLVGNLLDNAVRYTPAGGHVELRAAPHGDGCLVTVTDTGTGIEPEALEHIFDRFYRAEESRSRDAGGAGLGLSIVRRIAELHRGTIAVESAPGQGTTVRVRLPAAPPDRPPA